MKGLAMAKDKKKAKKAKPQFAGQDWMPPKSLGEVNRLLLRMIDIATADTNRPGEILDAVNPAIKLEELMTKPQWSKFRSEYEAAFGVELKRKKLPTTAGDITYRDLLAFTCDKLGIDADLGGGKKTKRKLPAGVTHVEDPTGEVQPVAANSEKHEPLMKTAKPHIEDVIEAMQDYQAALLRAMRHMSGEALENKAAMLQRELQRKLNDMNRLGDHIDWLPRH